MGVRHNLNGGRDGRESVFSSKNKGSVESPNLSAGENFPAVRMQPERVVVVQERDLRATHDVI